MTPGLRRRFRGTPPKGFVPLAAALERLGAARQAVRERTGAGRLDSCRVTRGKARGLYVRLPDGDWLPMLRGLIGDGEEDGTPCPDRRRPCPLDADAADSRPARRRACLGCKGGIKNPSEAMPWEFPPPAQRSSIMKPSSR